MRAAKGLFALIGLAAGGAALVLRNHGGRTVEGGILIADAPFYDRATGLLLGSLFDGIASDVAATASPGARVLEVGCGPGHLATRLARQSLVVTGLDLDTAMIERARANAARGGGPQPAFIVGDAGSLPFPDGSFDLVVTMLSMHHWSDAGRGLVEIGRVLRPGGRALVWDFRPGSGHRPPGIARMHANIPDPLEHMHGSALRPVSMAPWRWPWRIALLQRVELVRPER